MLRSLVGSEMCIRDSPSGREPLEYERTGQHAGTKTSRRIRRALEPSTYSSLQGAAGAIVGLHIERGAYGGARGASRAARGGAKVSRASRRAWLGQPACDKNCLLYTSDAADEEDSVDLGGRRIIKKKTNDECRGHER
eukprot:TRINITY_DN26627_c0_g1_i1.p1 TRINITY_DN26627_c0_g1~~TRINITY_DN26627_c0_g1_i1.p1  ORF type:complete len:138 (-),score=17.24 TRINITY_DN26627_c0_g1_i1:32-445(-)